MKTEYRLLGVGEVIEMSVHPAPSQRKMVPAVPTAHPWVGDERKTLRRLLPPAPAGGGNADHAPVGHVPDHRRMLFVRALSEPTAQPSIPPGRMKTEYMSIVATGTVAATQDIPSQ